MRYLNRLFFISFVFLVSCSKSGNEPELNSDPKLLAVSQVGTYTKAELIQQASAILGPSGSAFAIFLQHDVSLYKVSYTTTTTDDQKIHASGILVLPNTKTSLPLVSLQHGTLSDEASAPSYFKSGTESMIAVRMASAGFITSMPDYVGYGDSKSYPHPYEHAAGLAQANVDFLLAVKEYFKANTTPWNNNLLLAGYSEGGYATLATQKLIEEEYSSQFTIKASVCGAGAYNKSLTMDKLLKETSMGEANHNRSYIWVLLTYNRIYDLKKNIEDIFKEPYATQIKQNGYEVNITGSFNSLLNPSFVEAYNTGKEESIKEAFKKNDLINFKTNIPTLLVHGDSDEYVPYYNTETLYQGLKNNGSPNVSINTVVGGTHSSSIETFILQTFTVFSANKN